MVRRVLVRSRGACTFAAILRGCGHRLRCHAPCYPFERRDDRASALLQASQEDFREATASLVEKEEGQSPQGTSQETHRPCASKNSQSATGLPSPAVPQAGQSLSGDRVRGLTDSEPRQKTKGEAG